MRELNLRQTVLDLMPYKELLTEKQIVEIVEDHHRFTPSSRLEGLAKKIKDILVKLVNEGIFEVTYKHSGTFYFCEFKYYGQN